MIRVIGKQMIFPNEEKRFVLGDIGTGSRVFVIDRYEVDRTDLSDLTFRLDFRYKDGRNNSGLLVKSVKEDRIELTWDIIGSNFLHNGTTFISIRGYNEDGALRWNTAQAAIWVDESIDTAGGFTGDLSELEQLEKSISDVLDTEEARRAAEAARAEAENARVDAENARVEAENARVAAEIQREEEADQAEEARNQTLQNWMNTSHGEIENWMDSCDAESAEREDSRDNTLDEWMEAKAAELDAEEAERDGRMDEAIADCAAAAEQARTTVGPKGDKGDPFTIEGYYKTYEAMVAANANPRTGTAFGVGAEEPYDIWVYDGVGKKWVNNGPLQGKSAYATAVDGGYDGTEAEFAAMLSGFTDKLKMIEETHVATTDGQTAFAFDYATFDHTGDNVIIQSGRTILAPVLDYTVVSGGVVLTEGVPQGRTITVRILKNVNTDAEDTQMSGVYIKEGSIPLDRLAKEVATLEYVERQIADIPEPDVTSDVPMHMSVTASGGLRITYDDGQ